MLLIIEDDEVQRLTLAEILIEHGKLAKDKLLVAKNLTEAREHLANYGTAITTILSDNNIVTPTGEESGAKFLLEILNEQKQGGTPQRKLYLHSGGRKPEGLPEEIAFQPKMPPDFKFYSQLAQTVMAAASPLGNLHTSHKGQTSAPSF